MGRKPIRKQRRQEILDALYRCLLRKPYRDTTIKDIAAEASMNHGMLHYYYKSKDDILLSFIDYILELYKTDFANWLEKNSDNISDFRDLLLSVFNYMNRQITLDRNLSSIFIEIWEISMYNKSVHTRIKGMYREWVTQLTEIFKQNTEDPDMAARLAWSMVAFHEGTSMLSIIGDMNKQEVSELLTEFQKRLLDIL